MNIIKININRFLMRNFINIIIKNLYKYLNILKLF